MEFFFFQAEDGIRDVAVTGVQTCALPISRPGRSSRTGGTRTPRTCSPRSTTRWPRGSPILRGWASAGGATAGASRDRERGGGGKRVDLRGRRIIKKKKDGRHRPLA